MSSAAAAPPSKISFTVRRPATPASGSPGPDSESDGGFRVPALPRRLAESGRSTPASPLANGATRFKSTTPRHFRNDVDNSSNEGGDEDDEKVDVLISDFDHQRLSEKHKMNGETIVIPALANRDWRQVARKRKAAAMYTPRTTGTTFTSTTSTATAVVEISPKHSVTEQTDDEKAMRALIAEARGSEHDPHQANDSTFTIESLPDEWQQGPMTEADAYKRDIISLPDEAPLDAYERVPVEHFGAALLRGMGWKPGQAASRTRKGLAEPYLPEARPSLLGLGAKERVIPDDGSAPKKKQKPDRRYIPLVKKERDDSGRESGSSSRRPSRSPPHGDGYRDGDRDRIRDRDRDRERDRGRDGDRDRDRDRRRDYRERDQDRDRDRQHRKDRDHGSDRYRDREGRH